MILFQADIHKFLYINIDHSSDIPGLFIGHFIDEVVKFGENNALEHVSFNIYTCNWDKYCSIFFISTSFTVK